MLRQVDLLIISESAAMLTRSRPQAGFPRAQDHHSSGGLDLRPLADTGVYGVVCREGYDDAYTTALLCATSSGEVARRLGIDMGYLVSGVSTYSSP